MGKGQEIKKEVLPVEEVEITKEEMVRLEELLEAALEAQEPREALEDLEVYFRFSHLQGEQSLAEREGE